MSESSRLTDAMTHLVLERLHVTSEHRVSSYVLRQARLETMSDVVTGDLIARLTSHVLGDRMEPSTTTVCFDVYASWWQHTKAVHFPTFSRWLNRWPTHKRMCQTVTAENFATFPECRTDYPPDLGRPVRLTMLSGPRPLRGDYGAEG